MLLSSIQFWIQISSIFYKSVLIFLQSDYCIFNHQSLQVINLIKINPFKNFNIDMATIFQ